jgi:hypothetical protein
MRPEVLLPCSQEHSTGPYFEPHLSSPYHPILSKIHFNIVHPPTSFFSFFHQYPTSIRLFLHSCYMSCSSQPPGLGHSKHIISSLIKIINSLYIYIFIIISHCVTQFSITNNHRKGVCVGSL